MAELDGPEAPQDLLYLLLWFYQIRRGRGWSHDGNPLPLSWADLRAWADMMGHELTPQEASALFDLDRADRHPGEKDEE
ncbi:MAG: phage tail assembly chaperone [Mycobacterium sp.]